MADALRTQDDTEIWPVTLLQRGALYFVAVPAVDGAPLSVDPLRRPMPVQLPWCAHAARTCAHCHRVGLLMRCRHSVTAALCLLEQLVPFFQSPDAPLSMDALAEIQVRACIRCVPCYGALMLQRQCYLTTVMPFGTPLETDIRVVKVRAAGAAWRDRATAPPRALMRVCPALARTRAQALHHAGLPADETFPQKRPAWKPHVCVCARCSLPPRACSRAPNVRLAGTTAGSGLS